MQITKQELSSLKKLWDRLGYNGNDGKKICNKTWHIGLGGYNMGYMISFKGENVLIVNYEYKTYSYVNSRYIDNITDILKAIACENFSIENEEITEERIREELEQAYDEYVICHNFDSSYFNEQVKDIIFTQAFESAEGDEESNLLEQAKEYLYSFFRYGEAFLLSSKPDLWQKLATYDFKANPIEEDYEILDIIGLSAMEHEIINLGNGDYFVIIDFGF